MRNIKQLKEQLLFTFMISSIYIIALFLGFPIGDIASKITGIDCPGCGMTTAWYWLLKGNLEYAIYFHPLFIVPALLAGLYVLNNNVLKKSSKYITYSIHILITLFLIFYLIRVIYDIPGVIELEINPFHLRS